MNRGVLLKSLSCAYVFDLVFVSLVISVLSMEIIRQGPDCVHLAHQDQHKAVSLKQSDSEKYLLLPTFP